MPDDTEAISVESAVAALKRAEAQFALAERTAHIGAWRYDLATGATEWSPGLYAMMGLDPTRMSVGGGNWVLDLVRPEDVEAIHAEITRAIKAREPFRYRARSKSIGGTTTVFDTQGEVVYDGSGAPVALFAVSRNVSDLVDAERARMRAEEWYRCMADQASDIIALYGANGEVLFVSDALHRVLKRIASDLTGERFWSLVHPDDRAAAEKISPGPQPGETLTAEFRLQHGDGHYVWLETTSRGIYDEQGALQNIIAVGRDITERKRRETETAAARDEAVAANVAKSTFLANMSHELRTPLNAIIGFAEIMRRQMFGPLGSEQYGDYARLIHESGHLLLELISDVLDMAKIEAGKLELHIEQVEIGILVEDCMRLVEERAKQNEIALVCELSNAVNALQADRRALKQILLNLLSNAVKFTMPGGCVCVRTWAHRDGVAIAVQDDGVGIPAADLPRLGKPFEQAKTDATLSAGGAGLGLALVRALAEKHGGTMKIESEEGLGTTVTVWLPLVAAEQQSAA